MTDDRIDRLLPTSLTRRRVLGLGLAAAPMLVLASACSSDDSSSVSRGTGTSDSNRSLTPTPSCGDGDGDEVTPSLTEGPFFSSGSPERTDITDGADGTALVLTGVVLGTDCRTAAGAKLDFWHADSNGDYDNSGYRLRGHQFTDERGRYRLETIVPAIYPGRTRHIHVKVQPSGGSVLTTQLYFPGESENETDSLFEAECLTDVSTVGDGRAATFDFVVEV
jgi:protocatechuate 3,4-dioxygenase beta subunit